MRPYITDTTLFLKWANTLSGLKISTANKEAESITDLYTVICLIKISKYIY